VIRWTAKLLRRWETDVRARVGKGSGFNDQEAGRKGGTATKNLLEWGSTIKIGDIGFSAFGSGLRRCDSV